MGEAVDIYVKTHSLEPLKSFLGEITNCSLEKTDPRIHYSSGSVMGMGIQLTRRVILADDVAEDVAEIEGELIDYSELGYYISFYPTRDIFDISEMYDWQFHTSIYISIMISRKLGIECFVIKLDTPVAKFAPNEEPKYFKTYYMKK